MRAVRPLVGAGRILVTPAHCRLVRSKWSRWKSTIILTGQHDKCAPTAWHSPLPERERGRPPPFYLRVGAPQATRGRVQIASTGSCYATRPPSLRRPFGTASWSGTMFSTRLRARRVVICCGGNQSLPSFPAAQQRGMFASPHRPVAEPLR